MLRPIYLRSFEKELAKAKRRGLDIEFQVQKDKIQKLLFFHRFSNSSGDKYPVAE